jgi:transglutaminase-like putative cysteine protease
LQSNINGSLSGLTLPDTAPPATPTAADLAETEDIQLTAAIRTQAQALNNNPVQIHNWVRNNIEFLPSYGSIQGADLTLRNKRGNAFDTASLEIALLRAAGIPARYVYGTVQLPAEQAMNWVGGVSKPEAAQSLLGQGGIPNVAVIAGGKVVAFRLDMSGSKPGSTTSPVAAQ